MFCPGCGKEIPASSHFCPSCGHAIEAQAPVAATAGLGPKPSGMPTWLKVVLGVAGGFVLLIAFVVWMAMQLTSGLLEPVERHFADLKAGNYEAAYSELAIVTRQGTSLADFKAMIEHSPGLSHVVSESFSSRSTENDTGKLEGMLEIEGGGKVPIKVSLVKENGQWRILSYHTGP